MFEISCFCVKKCLCGFITVKDFSCALKTTFYEKTTTVGVEPYMLGVDPNPTKKKFLKTAQYKLTIRVGSP